MISPSKVFDVRKDFDIKFEESSVIAKDLELRQVQGQLKGWVDNSELQSLQGTVRFSEGRFKKWQFMNVFMPIQLKDSGYVSRGFSLEAYNGSGKGDIFLDKGVDIPYSMSIVLKDLNLNRLTDINAGVFYASTWILDGKINIQGSRLGLKSFTTSFAAPKGGMVKASLLKTVIQQIPESTRQRKELDLMIKEDAFSSFANGGRRIGKYGCRIHQWKD